VFQNKFITQQLFFFVRKRDVNRCSAVK